MNETKQKYPTSTVLICIMFLAIFIIMPPVCRVLYKEEVDEDPYLKVSKMTCTRNYTEENMTALSVARFDSGEIIDNTITFSKMTELADETKDSTASTYESEYVFLKSLDELNIINETDLEQSYLIDRSVLQANNDNLDLSNYFANAKNLKEAYTKKGYNCITE